MDSFSIRLIPSEDSEKTHAQRHGVRRAKAKTTRLKSRAGFVYIPKAVRIIGITTVPKETRSAVVESTDLMASILVSASGGVQSFV
jgi:hypothetical protein